MVRVCSGTWMRSILKHALLLPDLHTILHSPTNVSSPSTSSLPPQIQLTTLTLTTQPANRFSSLAQPLAPGRYGCMQPLTPVLADGTSRRITGTSCITHNWPSGRGKTNACSKKDLHFSVRHQFHTAAPDQDNVLVHWLILALYSPTGQLSRRCSSMPMDHVHSRPRTLTLIGWWFESST